MIEKNTLELLKEFFKNADATDLLTTDEIENETEDKLEDYINAADVRESICRSLLKRSKQLDDDTLFKLFENRIDIRKLMSDENFTSEYRYQSSPADQYMLITNTLEPILEDTEISDDDYRILYDNLLYRLEQNNEAYFAQLKIQVEKLPTEKVFGFLFENDKDFLQYIKLDCMHVTDINIALYILCKYYPSDIRILFSQDIQDIYNVYDRKRIKEISTRMQYQSISLDIDDTTMKELLLCCYVDRIIEMYKNNTSFTKIQKILTKECIANQEIPPTFKRYDRSSSAEKVLTVQRTLLPMNVIKQIVKDADMQISKVERYSTAN